MKNRKTYSTCFAIFLCISTEVFSVDYCSSLISDKLCSPVNQYKVLIDNNIKIGYEDERIFNLFGVHSLLWGVQDTISYSNGELTTGAVEKIREANVSIIRYGGGVNEIDWTQCIGPIAARRPQKLTRWMKPIQCRFGIDEYENLNNELGLGSSWYIANMVGLEFKYYDINLMSAASKNFALYVRSKAQGRKVYWELGNELGDGEQKWSADVISSRAIKTIESIKLADPAAIIVVPLLSFKPDWVRSDTDFNQHMVKKVLPYTSSFSLHTYYDNPPEGMSINHWLKRIRDTESNLKRAGVANPLIWISEHSRWPKGRPSEKDWLKQWKQAADFNAVLATADYLIGLSQIPSVNGAMWNTLKANSWTFLVGEGEDVQLSPIGELFKFLSPTKSYFSVRTNIIKSDILLPNGKEPRFTSMRESDSDPDSPVIIWSVNRGEAPINATFNVKSFSNILNKKISIDLDTMLESDVDGKNGFKQLVYTNKKISDGKILNSKGEFSITLPAKSVGKIIVKPAN